MKKNILDYQEPYDFVINITSLCNLNCYGCSAGCNFKEYNKFYINISDFKKNMNILKQKCIHLRDIIISGGEPLLHPNFIDICIIMREIFPTNNIVVFSNGILIDKLNDQELQKLQSLKIQFSISLYPDDQLFLKEYNSILKLEKMNLHTSIFEKSRLIFFTPNFSNKTFIGNEEAINNCASKQEKFFIIVNNKIFGCCNGFLFYNLNKILENDDYIFINDYLSETDIYNLKNKIYPMCNYCRETININDKDFTWTQKIIKNKNFDPYSLLNTFLYDYDFYEELKHNNNKNIKFLNNIIFDYGLRKEKNEGYKKYLVRYFDGEGDICLLIDDNFQISNLKSLYHFLLYQKNIQKFNIYIFCLTNNITIQTKIYNLTYQFNNELNLFLLKKMNYNEALNYFFKNSFSKKYYIIDNNFKINNLKEKNFLNLNLIKKDYINEYI